MRLESRRELRSWMGYKDTYTRRIHIVTVMVQGAKVVMGLRATDIVLSSSASKSLENLETGSNPNSASIARRIRALKAILLSDCLHGEVVKKDRIPRPLKDKHVVENLFVEDLP